MVRKAGKNQTSKQTRLMLEGSCPCSSFVLSSLHPVQGFRNITRRKKAQILSSRYISQAVSQLEFASERKLRALEFLKSL